MHSCSFTFASSGRASITEVTDTSGSMRSYLEALKGNAVLVIKRLKNKVQRFYARKGIPLRHKIHRDREPTQL